MDKAGDFIVDQNQSIIALGNVGPATKRAIYKIDSSGKRDSSFGTNGVNITENSRQYKISWIISNIFGGSSRNRFTLANQSILHPRPKDKRTDFAVVVELFPGGIYTVKLEKHPGVCRCPQLFLQFYKQLNIT